MRSRIAGLAAATASLSREEAALILVLGLALGTFPVVGCPTLFCAIAALTLRLNATALQLVNQLSSPIQLALLLLFVRIGWHVALPASAPAFWKTGALMLQAITGWCLISIPCALLLYVALLFVLRRSRRPWPGKPACQK